MNCAGILRRVPIAEVEEALWRQVMDVNLLSQLTLCRAAGRPMRRQKFGRIVNLTSTAGFNGGANHSSVYAISKGGVLALTKSLAREFAPDGVCVNALCPGGIDTPMGRQGFPILNGEPTLIPMCLCDVRVCPKKWRARSSSWSATGRATRRVTRWMLKAACCCDDDGQVFNLIGSCKPCGAGDWFGQWHRASNSTTVCSCRSPGGGLRP